MKQPESQKILEIKESFVKMVESFKELIAGPGVDIVDMVGTGRKRRFAADILKKMYDNSMKEKSGLNSRMDEHDPPPFEDHELAVFKGNLPRGYFDIPVLAECFQGRVFIFKIFRLRQNLSFFVY